MRTAVAAILAIFTAFTTGCGTLVNLHDSPKHQPMMMVPQSTIPMGGTLRSTVVAVVGTPLSFSGAMQNTKALVTGKYDGDLKSFLTPVAAMPLCMLGFVDIPLSLVGDIVTLPIAFARMNEHQWATWWGKESVETKLIPHEPVPEKDDLLIQPAQTIPERIAEIQQQLREPILPAVPPDKSD